MPGRRGEESDPREKARKKRERRREREKKLTAVPDSSVAPMAGNVVVVEADPWDPLDVTKETLQSLVDD